MIKASTLYEVLIAMLLFVSVALTSFYIIVNVQSSSHNNASFLKFEPILNNYKINGEKTLDKAMVIKVSDHVSPHTNIFFCRKYQIESSKGEILYIKEELVKLQENEN